MRKDDLFEFEVAVDSGGDAPSAEPEPSEPEPAEPEPTEPAEPEAAWAGPTREEWEQTQAQLAQASELAQLLEQSRYQQPDQQGEPEPLPEFDPFDPESVNQFFDVRDQRLLDQFGQMLSPVVEKEQNAQAEAWAEDTFSKLGVPEDDVWRESILFGSAGFQQFDAQGRPLVPPQQAVKQAYDMQHRFADHIRADERAKIEAEQKAASEALENRAGAPVVQSGPAGGEGVPEGMDELEAARRWREREQASAG